MDEKVVCDVCGILVNKNRYERHKQFGHKEKTKKDFICNLCQKNFTSLYNLQYHMAHHINARSFLCNECPRAYNTAADLSQHQRIHDKQKDPYKCEHCGMFFQIMSKYKTHMKIHKEKTKEPKECPICKKSFICLSDHKRNVHMNLKNHSCQYCDKKFGKKSGLDRHILSIHEKQRNHVCDLCGKGFGEKAQLKKHEKVHSLVKDVTYCTQCKEYFKDIKDHYENVHADIKYSCQSCFKRFKRLRDFDIHIKTVHSTFRSYFCDYCSKGFAEKFQLKRHVRIHAKNSNDINIKGDIKDEMNENSVSSEIEQIFVDVSISDVKVENDPDESKMFNNIGDILNETDIKEEPKSDDEYGCELDYKDFEDIGKHESESFENEEKFKMNVQADQKINTHQCDFCNEIFNDKSMLQQHMADFHLTKDHDNSTLCIGCGNQFNSKSEMQNHFNKTHDTLNGFHCTMCNKMFGKLKLLKIHHQANHTDFKYDCKKCNKKFGYKSALDRHYKRRHLQERNHICQECGKEFGTKFELDQHFEGHHGNLTKANRTCNSCDKTFINEKNLKMHIQAIHSNNKFECEICKKAFSFESAKQRHMKSAHFPEEHQCEICMKKCISRYALKYHFDRYHSGKERKRYNCQKCNKDFCSSSALSRHRKGVHENIKQKTPVKFRCKICHEQLSNKYQKQKHLTQVHHNGKKLKRVCGYCKMEFQFYDDFKNHIESHAGIFICITCGESFMDLEILNQHVENHKRIELKLRKFECDFCGHRIFNKVQLNVHMRKHVQDKNFYVCDICGQSYKFLAPFLYHKKLHSGKKDYVCTYCNKEFVQKQDLLIHARQHTNEKPFKCHVCGKRFSLKQFLNVHLQTHSATRVSYKCHGCDQTFFDRKKLRFHEEKFHPEERPFVCFICNMTFKYEHNLRSHNNRKHKLSTNAFEVEADQINLNNLEDVNNFGIVN